MDNNRLVYSTQTGRICSGCGKPTADCGCKKGRPAPKKALIVPGSNDGAIRIRREVKGRRGKTVTAIFGIPLAGRELQQFVKQLKQRCGSGGSIKDGVVVIQGDHRDILQAEIAKRGWPVKLAGG